MTRKTKSISFDLSDEYEKELLTYAEKQGKYFSRYIKRLIDRDKNKIVDIPVMEQITEDEENTDGMSSFL